MASQFRRLAAVLFSSTILACPALAQDGSVEEDSAPVYLEADTLEDIENGRGYIARGDVRAQQAGRTLFADEIEYYPEENRVVARGNVIIHGQGDFPQYAEEAELDSELASGIALGFATMLENNGRMAAATAIRSANGDIELSNAYYTACPLCEDGEGNPTWRIRAGEVIQDVDDQMLYYRDAQLEVMGVPVLYAPVFAHPDPSSERRSGLLLPKVGVSNRLGFLYQQPYLWSISPSQDLVIAPRYMSNVNPLIFTEYRKRFWSGEAWLEGSYTSEYEIDSDGERDLATDDEAQWHVFASGRFDISPTMRWGFGVQRASYDLYLRRYDFDERFTDENSVVEPPSRHLVSQLYLEHRDQRSYGTAFAASYQTLRSDKDDKLPVIQPMAQYRYVLDAPENWGRVNLDASGAMLEREDGSDYRRASTGFDWQTQWIGPAGLVITPSLSGRADHFEFNDLDPQVYSATNQTLSREVGMANLEISWPLLRPGENFDLIVEPVLSTTAASDDPIRDDILNEDSLTVDIDEYLLLDPSRSPGFDIWEEGHWAVAGLRATTLWGEDDFARFFLGQGERLSGDAVFGPSSGLFEDRSDYVVSAEINWGAFEIEMNSRLDQDDFDVNRMDFYASYRSDFTSLRIGFTDISDDTVGSRAPDREIEASYQFQMSEHWGLVGSLRHDLDAELLRQNEVALRYEDDCTRFDIVYRLDDSTSDQIGRSESIGFEFTLFTLGGVEND